MDDARKRDVRSHFLDLDGRFVPGPGIGNDHDVAPLNFRDSVTLVADCLDRHVANLALVDGRFGGTTLTLATRTVGRLGFLF
jgi:hypothetical protein